MTTPTQAALVWPNSKTITLITSWEKRVNKVYLDGGGVKTGGIGHTGPDVNALKVGTVLTAGQIDRWFHEDVMEAVGIVARYIKVPLTENQRGALVSFAFNVGAGQFGGSTLVRKLNAHNYDAIPGELAKWVNDNGKRVKGLVNRRNAETALWLSGNLTPATYGLIEQGIPAGSAKVVTKTGIVLSPEVLTTVGVPVATAVLPAAFTGNPLSIAAAIGGLIVAAVVAVLLYKRLNKDD